MSTFKTTPYRRGYVFERRVKRHLEVQGWYVVRQGKSAFPDLICLKKVRESIPTGLCRACGANMEGKTWCPTCGEGIYSHVLFVECKVDGYLTRDEKSKMAEIVRVSGGQAVVAYREGRNRLVFKDMEFKP